jgi:hypothetical protein
VRGVRGDLFTQAITCLVTFFSYPWWADIFSRVIANDSHRTLRET